MTVTDLDRPRETADGDPGDGAGRRRVLTGVVMGLAGALVVGALLLPTGPLTPASFLRLPVELLVGIAVLLVLPGRVRRVVAALWGVALGLLVLLKLLDVGFRASLARPFDPVLDWPLFGDAGNFLDGSVGRAGAIGAAVGVVLLAVAVLAAMTWAVLRVGRAVGRRRVAVARTLAVLTGFWVACALLGVQLVPGVPVADRDTTDLVRDRALLAADRLRDGDAFAEAMAVDAFRDVPPDRLLTALRGKDVVLAFVESYGRDAVEDPEFAPQVGALLADGDRRLAAAGYASRSGFLTSSTSGGASWLAHATLLSGVWVDNQQRYDALLASDRLTLPGAFGRASWRTVGVMPNTVTPWPEGISFYGYDRLYDQPNLGYRGPAFSWSAMPDQYTLAAFERAERAAADRGPVMAEIALVSSHAPWSPLPRLVGWDELGDGSIFEGMSAPGSPTDVIFSRDPARVRADYRASIGYSLESLVSYVETYGDDDLVLVFLGDHQPAPVVTGEGASRDVPITIVARDRAVLDRIASWGWTDGLRPDASAPVWRMDTFRDRFLTAFGS